MPPAQKIRKNIPVLSENTPIMDGGKKRVADGERSAAGAKKRKLSTLNVPSPAESSDQTLNGPTLCSGTVIGTNETNFSMQNVLPGWIKRVEVKNFMIYKERTFELGPFVNFVTGRNGSGKSSFALAIEIGLGQRCSSTDRNGNLEDLIKTGENQAVIRIVLSNQGIKPLPGWGDSITIERKITKKKTYSDGYRISSEDGSIVKRKKKDLEKLLFQLNIYIDNPVFILSQTRSKEFFDSQSSSNLYKFFYQSFGYEEAEMRYEQAKSELESADRTKKQKDKELENLRTELDVWVQRKIESADDDGGWQSRRNDAEIQDVLWKVDENMEKVDSSSKNLTAKKKLLSQMQAQLSLLEDDSEPLQFSLSQINMGSQQETTDELHEKEMELATNKRRRAELEAALRTKRESLMSQRSISQITGSQSSFDDSQSLNTSLVESLFPEEDSLPPAEMKHLQERKKELGKLLSARTGLEKSIATLESSPEQLKEARRLLDQTVRSIQLAENPASSQMSLDFQEAFQQKVWETNTPIGPIGSLISLNSEEYANFGKAADQALSSVLSAYLVTSLNDAVLLQSTFLEIGAVMPTIICADLDILNATEIPKRPVLPLSLNAVFLEDIIDAPDLIVKEFLLKILCIRQIAFVKSSELESGINLFEAGIPNLKIYDEKGFLYINSKGDQSITCPVINCPAVLSKINQQQLSDLRNDRQRLVDDIQILEEKVERLRSERIKHGEYRDELMNIEKKLHKYSTPVKNNSVQSSFVRRSIRRYTPRITQNGSIPSCSKQPNNDVLDDPDLREELMQLNRDDFNLVKQIDRIKKRISMRDANKAKLSAKKKISHANATAKIQTLEKDISKDERDIARMSALIEEYSNYLQARNVDVFDDRTDISHAVVVDRIRNLEREKEKRLLSSSKFSKEQCHREIQERSAHISSVEEDMRLAREIVEDIRENNKIRLSKLGDNTKRGENLASEKCRMILKEGRFDGRLEFDTEKKRCQYFVKVPGNDNFGTVESLSGGEKAYAMAAFLGAMWERNAPFRLLDEFDVFMDVKNREVALKCLVGQAFQFQLQCIFLSPSDISLINIIPTNSADLLNFVTRITTETEDAVSFVDDDSCLYSD